MAIKKKPAPEAPKDKRVLRITQHKDEDPDEAVSKTMLSPEVTAAFNMQSWEDLHTVDGLRVALTQQIDEVHGGSMKRPEAMLLCQAHALDALFNNLAGRAQRQEYIKNQDSYLRLAFKAQAQCRATLEALAAIKNPPVIFAKQANISNGHQQINNGIPVSHTGEIKSRSNELLTELPNATLDTRRTGEAISIDKDLEAVGEVHRGANS